MRRNANPLNTSRNQKRDKAKGPTPEKRKSHNTHPPCDGDGPRDRVSGQQGGPTATFWPNHGVPHGYIFGTGRVDNLALSAGATGSLASQTGSRSEQSTKQ